MNSHYFRLNPCDLVQEANCGALQRYPCCVWKRAVSQYDCCWLWRSSQQFFVIVLLPFFIFKEEKSNSLKGVRLLVLLYGLFLFLCTVGCWLFQCAWYRTHPISVHGGNFHSFQWELSEYGTQDFDRYLSLQLVLTVPRLLEVILQAQSASVFISYLFSLLSKKCCMTAVIPYPRLKPCEQSAADLRQHNCDSVCEVSLTTALWLPKLPCFSTHIKHKFLRSTQNHSNDFLMMSVWVC